MRITACVIMSFYGAIGAAHASAQSPDATDISALPPAVIQSTRQFDLTSAINGEAYRVQIFIPNQAPTRPGYPALYVLDGNVLFGTYAGAVRTKALAHEIEPAVVVGIASGSGPNSADRTFDFTMRDRTEREKTIVKEMDLDQKVGGAEAFFRVIQNEIRPQVAKVAPIDDKRSALFGWSLGGLFVTHTMFAHPNAFGTYIAVSPSLWYDDREAFREVPAFLRQASLDSLRPRFFLAVGGREEQVPAVRSGATSDRDVAAEFAYYRMVGNARDMNHALFGPFRRLGAPRQFRVLANDTHNSAPWSVINPALDFAFPLADAPAP